VRRVAWLLLASVTAAGVLILFVFPGRTLLTQDRNIAAAQTHINALDRANSVLRQRQAALDDPAQIEQMARERFGMVLSGQQAYAITPPSAPASTKPAVVPKTASHPWWHDLEFWH
jgi:cell division protein FtsB